jgi:hypothetical protein
MTSQKMALLVAVLVLALGVERVHARSSRQLKQFGFCNSVDVNFGEHPACTRQVATGWNA